MSSRQPIAPEVSEVPRASSADEEGASQSTEGNALNIDNAVSETSVVDNQANAVSKAMGGITDHLQSQLKIPGSRPGGSTASLYYSVSAQALVRLDGHWEIVPGLQLRGVQLRTKIAKASTQPVTLGVELSAFLLIKDYKVKVSGIIPQIQQGRDIEFSLKLEASSCLRSIDTGGLVGICTNGNGNVSNSATTGYQDLIAKAGLQDDIVDASMAELTIIRDARSERFHLKRFEIRIAANIDWEIVPGKLRLQRATALLQFSKEKIDDAFLTRLELAGTIGFQGPPKTTIGLKTFLCLNEGCVRLCLATNVAASQGIKPSQVVDLITGEENTNMSLDSTGDLPGLDLPQDGSWSFDLCAVVQRKGGKWSLQYARAAVQIKKVWAPWPELILGDLQAFLMVFQPDLKFDDFREDRTLDHPRHRDRLAAARTKDTTPDTGSKQASSGLKVAGWISGTVHLGSARLQATVHYVPVSQLTKVQCYIEDAQNCSITDIVSNTQLYGQETTPSHQEINEALNSTTAPPNCPVDFWLLSAPGYGTQRRCTLSFEGSQLKRLVFSMRSAGEENAWHLTDTIRLQDMGLSVTYEPTTSAAGGFGDLKGYAYGHLHLEQNSKLTLFALVAGRKKSEFKEFFVHLSGSMDPNATIGLEPKALLTDPTFADLQPQIDGWELPSSLPSRNGASVSHLFHSVSAKVSLKLVQRETSGKDAGKSTSHMALQYVQASLAIKGGWEIFDGLQLQDLSIHALVRPKDQALKSDHRTDIEVRGIMQATTQSSNYILAVSAAFKSQTGCSRFMAQITARVNEDTDSDCNGFDDLPLTPNDILGLTAFGSQGGGDIKPGLVPDSFPLQPQDVLGSKSAECNIEVEQDPATRQWTLSQIAFSLASTKEWQLLDGKLRLKSCELYIQVKKPRSEERNILACANTLIQVGDVEIDSGLIFRKGEAGNLMIFKLKARADQVKRIVSTLTDQSLEELSPSAAPKIDTSVSLALQIICAWPTSKSTTTMPWLKSVKLEYQPGTALTLEPFSVRKLALFLSWGTPEQAQKPAIRVSLNGEVSLGQVPVEIELSYGGSSPDSLRFTMQPSRPLSLTAITQANQQLSKPSYDLPSGCGPFDGFNVSDISGVFGKRVASDSSLKLIHLEANIVSDQTVDILQLEDGLGIQLYKVGLHWKYTHDGSHANSCGVVFADLHCRRPESSSPQLKSVAKVEFTKDEHGRETFCGKLELQEDSPDTDRPIDYSDLLCRFLPQKSYKVPEHIKLPSKIPLLMISVKLVRGHSVEITALGRSQWTPPIEGTDIALTELGLDIKAKKEGSASRTTAEARITGVLTFNHFKSVDTLRAWFSIGTSSNATLRATIEKCKVSASDGETNKVGDLEQLTSQLTTTSLKSLAPDASSRLSFNDGARVVLYVHLKDASKIQMMLSGNMPGVGHALFFLRGAAKSDSRRQYVVSVSLTSLIALFPTLAADINAGFDLAPIEVNILSYAGTVADLNADLSAGSVVHLLPGSVSDSRCTSPFSMVDTKEAVEKGVWFFAGIKLEGHGSMTEALTAIRNPAKEPRLALYGRLTTTATEYKIIVRDLFLLNDALHLDGRGTYRKDKATNMHALTLEGTLTLLGLDGNTTPPQLKASVDISERMSTFVVADTGSSLAKISNPFGAMFNITLGLRSLSGTVYHEKGKQLTSQFSASGFAAFGKSPSSLNLGAKVIFINGVPKVVVVNFTNMAIQGSQGLFGKVIEPEAGDEKPGSWPSDYPDITMSKGAIYYAKETVVDLGDTSPTKATYSAGYGVEAELVLFEAKFNVLIHILAKRAGVKIQTSSVATIDLEFVKLLNPSLSIDSTKSSKRFAVETDVEFFQETSLHMSFSYEPSSDPKNKGPCYRGSLKRPADAKPFVTIKYHDMHWGFENWYIPGLPDAQIDELVKIYSAIEDATKKGAGKSRCGALVGFFFKEVIVTRFKWKITTPEGKPMFKDKKLTLRLVWSYDIKSELFDADLVGLDLPDIEFIFPGPFTLSEIDKMLVNIIRDNLHNIGQAILDRPEYFAKIIGVIALDRMGPKIVESLLCRQKNVTNKSQNLKQRGEEVAEEESNAVEESQTSAEESLGQAEQSLVEGLDAAAAGGGGAAAIGTSLGALSEGIGAAAAAVGALAGVLASIVGFLAELFGASGKQKRVNKLKQRQRANDERIARIKSRIEASLVLTSDPLLKLINGIAPREDRLSMDWTQCLPTLVKSRAPEVVNNLLWSIKVIDGNGNSIYEDNKPAYDRSATCSTADVVFGTKLMVSIRASFKYKQTRFNGPWSQSTMCYDLTLPAPEVEHLQLSGHYTTRPGITVGFTAPASGVYEMALVPSDRPTVDNAIHNKKEHVSGQKDYVAFWDMMPSLVDLQSASAIKLIVRQITTAATRRRGDSAWVVSQLEVRIQVAPDIAPATARLVGEDQDVILEWAQANSKPVGSDDFFLAAVDDAGHLVACKCKGLDSPAGRRVARLTSPPILTRSSGREVGLLITPRPVQDQGLIFYLPRSFNIPVVPWSVLKIDDNSYLDLETEQASLFITLQGPCRLQDLGPTLLVEALTDTREVQESAYVAISKHSETKGSVLWPTQPNIVKESPRPWALRLTAMVPTPAGDLASSSKPWHLPDGPIELMPPCLSTMFAPGGGLTISWPESLMTPETDYGFCLDTPGSDPKKRLNFNFLPASGQNLCELFANEVVQHQRHGMLLVCFVLLSRYQSVLVRSPHYYLSLSVPTIQEPGPLMSDSLDWPICPQSSIVSLPQSNALKPVVFVTASSYNTNETLLLGIFLQDRTAKYLWVTIMSSGAIRNGTALATCSRDPSHAEVFWITQQGGIQGRVWRGGARREEGWRTGFDYPFCDPETAAIVGGGSLSVVIVNSKRMELYWVGPLGDIRMASWAMEAGWAYPVSITAEQVVDLGNKETPGLSPALAAHYMTSVDKTIAIWIGHASRLYFTVYPGHLEEFQIIDLSGVEVLASPAAGVAIRETHHDQNSRIWVFWVTPTGGVKGAFNSANHLDKDAWTVFDVAEDRSAHPKTRLTLIPWDNSPYQHRHVLLWFDPELNINAATTMSSHAREVLSWYRFDFPWSTSAPSDAMLQVTIAAWQDSFVLSWVGEGQRLQRVIFYFDGVDIKYSRMGS